MGVCGESGKDSETWGYSYAGTNTACEKNNFSYEPETDDALEDYAWYDNNSSEKTHAVGLKKPNSLGLYDMSGNVQEWCWDWYDSPLSAETVTDPTVPDSGEKRLLRGGAWNYCACFCAVSIRLDVLSLGPIYGFKHVGIRLVRSLGNEN